MTEDTARAKLIAWAKAQPDSTLNFSEYYINGNRSFEAKVAWGARYLYSRLGDSPDMAAARLYETLMENGYIEDAEQILRQAMANGKLDGLWFYRDGSCFANPEREQFGSVSGAAPADVLAKLRKDGVL